NMWDSYNVERIDLDSILKQLINSFLEKNNFGIATNLINKLNSLPLKQDLSKVSAELEDKYQESIKKEFQDYLKKGEEILAEYVKTELDIIIEMNKERIEQAESLVKQDKSLKAGNLLLNHASYLKKIGREDIKDQILTNSLDIFLEGEIYEEFFNSFYALSKEMKEKYLIRIFPSFIHKLQNIEKFENYERIEKILEESNRIYRNHSLYDNSKEISLIFIKNIKKEALAIINTEENISGIDRADELVKKATKILSAYFDKEERSQINFDEIYKKISEIYIEIDDLHSAQTYNDRIENMAYNKEIHKKIAELEAKKSEAWTKKAEESREEEELEEALSIIINKAREALLDQGKELKERKALRRAYFHEALNHLENDEIDKSIEVYKKTISQLNRIKKYKLAGVSLAVVCLLLIKEEKFNEVREILENTKEKLSSLGDLFSKTFPVTLTEYIIQIKKHQDENKVKEAISFIENLPLFKEELKILNDYLGEDYKKDIRPETFEKSFAEDKIEEEPLDILSREQKGELSKIQLEIDQNFGKIESKMGDIRREKDEFFIKRKAMKRRYYNEILDMLESQKFKEVATKYYDLAITLSKRKDLKTSALLILLHGLSLLKEQESYSIIKKKINDFLNSLGINKSVVKDTFYIMVIFFILDVKIYTLDKYLPKIKGMLEILPLFIEEEELINI
ncbi:MAG: hypothetical protein ACFFD7_15530, partial [Candidatus Thorarchaeota archaeon]